MQYVTLKQAAYLRVLLTFFSNLVQETISLKQMETIGENIQYSSQSDLILYGNIIMGGQVY
jgi:hypothetical protein